MNAKKTISALLLLFVVATVGTMVVKGIGSDNAYDPSACSGR